MRLILVGERCVERFDSDTIYRHQVELALKQLHSEDSPTEPVRAFSYHTTQYACTFVAAESGKIARDPDGQMLALIYPLTGETVRAQKGANNAHAFHNVQYDWEVPQIPSGRGIQSFTK